MTENFIGIHPIAQFRKCALQVNPYNYIEFQGLAHGLSEEEYNQQLLQICIEEKIEVVGIADHGNVDCIEPIRDLFKEHGIVVFPGFEICSSEKAHFVCLFPEFTKIDELHRYLGTLGMTDIEDGVRPSNLTGIDLLSKVWDLGGLTFAAHVTSDSGVLFQKLPHIWRDKRLVAAQIPKTLDELHSEKTLNFYRILTNQDPAYAREQPIALINSRDVKKPEDLKNPTASCLIKMTVPCFSSFKQAFLDPESRVRLNSDVPEEHYSWINRIEFTGGYLDEINITFSKHLNAIIGGRGTGKSTLLECIRYALDIRPIGKNAIKQHDEIIKENLGKVKARIEIFIRSSVMNGREYSIARRYGESPIVKDDKGSISTFTPRDLLPHIEIFGQNEIYEIAQDPQNSLTLLNRFQELTDSDYEKKRIEILHKLKKNREEILDAKKKLNEVNYEVERLPRIREQVEQYTGLGLQDKLKLVPIIEKEKVTSERIRDEIQILQNSILQVKDNISDTTYLNDSVIQDFIHKDIFIRLQSLINGLNGELTTFFSQCDEIVHKNLLTIEKELQILSEAIIQSEENLHNTFKDIPECHGRSGKEIGILFQTLLRDIERIKPKETMQNNLNAQISALNKTRTSLLAELSEIRSKRSANLQRGLSKLNKKLSKKLKLHVNPESDRSELITFLLNSNLDGIGQKRLSFIETIDDFSPVRFAHLIREGTQALRDAGWSITPSLAEALPTLSFSKIMELEEFELRDVISIELNVSHEGKEVYRSLERLSTGQQCTAILHLLLLENNDPLIIDQPEDNLDNAFIADRIVIELRSEKISRQFIFATHNANIPVFGDAEWIGVIEAEENHASIPDSMQGAIDIPQIQQRAADILEGGKKAFNQRKDKYGF